IFTHSWRSLLAYLVALHLLCPGSAPLRVVALSLPVTATEGQDVMVCFHLSPCKNARILDVRWIRHQSSGLVHHYQNGEDLEQMEEYKGRTELLRDGNLDLHITAVSSSDSGSYICHVQNDGGYAKAVVDLELSAQIVHPWKVALTMVLTLLVVSFLIIRRGWCAGRYSAVTGMVGVVLSSCPWRCTGGGRKIFSSDSQWSLNNICLLGGNEGREKEKECGWEDRNMAGPWGMWKGPEPFETSPERRLPC
uniref:Ig-like domain-containing protein n=1 Tax=Meleagris gallopavo TaxID=9103 RepID=G1N9X2_MELGA